MWFCSILQNKHFLQFNENLYKLFVMLLLLNMTCHESTILSTFFTSYLNLFDFNHVSTTNNTVPVCRSNIAIMFMSDLVLDGLEIDWSAHLPHMLHVIFLGMWP